MMDSGVMELRPICPAPSVRLWMEACLSDSASTAPSLKCPANSGLHGRWLDGDWTVVEWYGGG